MASPTPKRETPFESQLGGFIRAVIREEMEAALDEKIPGHLKALQMIPPRAVPVESVYVTRKQAAAITGYSLRTIIRLIASGELPACGPRQDRIKRSDIERLMARRPKRADDGDDAIDREVDRLFKGDK